MTNKSKQACDAKSTQDLCPIDKGEQLKACVYGYRPFMSDKLCCSHPKAPQQECINRADCPDRRTASNCVDCQVEQHMQRLTVALEEILRVGDEMDWPNVESAKYCQAHLYHEMRKIAKAALGPTCEDCPDKDECPDDETCLDKDCKKRIIQQECRGSQSW